MPKDTHPSLHTLFITLLFLSFCSTLSGVIGRCRSRQSNSPSLSLCFFGVDLRGQPMLTAPIIPIIQILFLIPFVFGQRDQPMLTALTISYISFSFPFLSALICATRRSEPRCFILFIIFSFYFLFFFFFKLFCAIWRSRSRSSSHFPHFPFFLLLRRARPSEEPPDCR